MTVGNVFDIVDRDKYSYLDPLWTLLENTPDDVKLTYDEIYTRLKLDPLSCDKMVNEFANEWMNNFIKQMKNPLKFIKIARDDFYDKQLKNNWGFDKVMLLVTRVQGSRELPDNPIFNDWKNRWIEDRGR